MRRPAFGLVLLAMLAAASSVRAQQELDELGAELESVEELVGAIESQYDRVLERLGLPEGLDAEDALNSDDLGQLVVLTADRLEAHTPGRGSAFLALWKGIADLLGIKSATRLIRPAIDWLRRWWDSGDEEIVRSIRAHAEELNGLLLGIQGQLRQIKAVLDRIESELANL